MFPFTEHPLFSLTPNRPLPSATCQAERLSQSSAVLGAGTFLGGAIKMKFTAGTPVEALEQTHPQPGTRRDAPRGAGQRSGSWRTPPCATSVGSGGPRAGAAGGGGGGEDVGAAKPPRDEERSGARLKPPLLPRAPLCWLTRGSRAFCTAKAPCHWRDRSSRN